jgi:hypothetical protein
VRYFSLDFCDLGSDAFDALVTAAEKQLPLLVLAVEAQNRLAEIAVQKLSVKSFNFFEKPEDEILKVLRGIPEGQLDIVNIWLKRGLWM